MRKNISQKIAAILVPASLLFSSVAPVFAEENTETVNTGSAASTSVRAAKKVEIKDVAVRRAHTEIEKREKDLNRLLKRISEMKHVSDDTKTAISTTVQETITRLGYLRTEIENETDKEELKKDMKNITEGTRVYLVVIQKARILAAVDRIGEVSKSIEGLNTKLQARVQLAQTAGKDVSAITALQADIVAKLAEAKTQATLASTTVASLVADNGDKTVFASNEAAFKTARTAIKTAETNLKIAQKDIKTITSILKSVHPNNRTNKISDDKPATSESETNR